MASLIQVHKDEYGTVPNVVAYAPGRFHLIGEHTWFFKDKTLSMAVNIPVYVAISKRTDANLYFHFVQLHDTKKCSIASLKYKKEDKWANALKAVVSGFLASGVECEGMNFTIYSTVLPSAGFGITTAIKVAAAFALKELYSLKFTKEDLVLLLEKTEKLFFGSNAGRAELYTAIYSKKDSLVITDHTRLSYDIIPFNLKGRTVILTDAKVPRISTWNEESLRQPENALLLGELRERKMGLYGGWHYIENGAEISETLSVVDEDVRKRLICIMNEHKDVLNAKNSLEKNNFASFAKTVNHSHESMRDLYDISSPEIDWIIKRVKELNETSEDLENPINCARITGKGFGRCVYAILRNEYVDKYMQKLQEYERIFGFKCESHIVKPAEGVHLQ